jgi:predicted MFS family arabinose efflux permease
MLFVVETVITALETSFVMLIVGEELIASLNVAVIVTVLESLTKLSESESVKRTPGGLVSGILSSVAESTLL